MYGRLQIMDNQKIFEKLEKHHSFEDCAKFALFLMRKVNSISPSAFDEWTEINVDVKDTEKKKDLIKAQQLLSEYKNDIISFVSVPQLKNYLVKKLLSNSTSQKLNIILDLIEELFQEVNSTPLTGLLPIIEKLSHIKTDEDFFNQLPENIQGEGAILLAKLLLNHEYERIKFNEDWVADNKMLDEHKSS